MNANPFHIVRASEPSSNVYEPEANSVRELRPAVPPIATDLEAQLIAILVRTRTNELPSAEFRAKELEIGAIFATLTPVESLALHRRLASPKPDDDLAQRFSRLVVDRRNRLLFFLADVRRRGVTAQQARK